MTARKLDKRQWSTFLNGVTRMLEGKRAEVEVASLRLGDQVEAEWLPLLGIAYDSKDDICLLRHGHPASDLNSSKASNLHLIIQLMEQGRSTAPDRPAFSA